MALEHNMSDGTKSRAAFDEKVTGFDDRYSAFDQNGQKPGRTSTGHRFLKALCHILWLIYQLSDVRSSA
ncbi:hypothetical protein [Parasphingorhabdus litoris]|uniref:hypothetical protein n=1 Tax=Parasphingorhabdus litoris TaxID=394733 RepID=UPI001E4A6D94|nr:hypothetical protein [Parasphingorhabdus litoris]